MEIKDLISKEYQEQNRLLHERENWGESGIKHLNSIFDIIDNNKIKTLLDYGCGCGTLKNGLIEEFTDLPTINEYDPAIPGKDMLPTTADIVVCTDVMEHIEPEKLEYVMQHLYDLTNKFLYLAIATRPSNRILPDGRDTHLIIQTPEWWAKKFLKFKWHKFNYRVEYIKDVMKPKEIIIIAEKK